MAQLTASEVIDRGDYLKDDFDPSTLKISHLLSIFNFHGVRYPSQHTKAKLVTLFNEEIKPRVVTLRRERVERENSEASDRGITDGITGVQIGESDPDPEKTIRRSARRSSRISAEPSSPTPDPPKRRRSSAGPTVSRAKLKNISIAPVLTEESEPEDEGEPSRKVVRRGKGSHSTSKSRVVSGKLVSAGEESAWEDNNVFQSGPESSSPPKPPKSTRGGSTSRRTRKPRASISAPPELISPSSNTKVPSSDFKPRITGNIGIPQGGLRHVSPPVEKIRLSSSAYGRYAPAAEGGDEDEGKVDAEPESDYYADGNADDEVEFDGENGYDAVLSSKISQLGSDLSTRKGKQVVHQAKRGNWRRLRISQLVYVVLFVIIMTGIWTYKSESVEIGYCDTGATTNAVVVEKQAKQRTAVEHRSRLLDSIRSNEGSKIIQEDLISELSLILRYYPTSCTPCPSRAICQDTGLTCPPPLILHSHVLSRIPALSWIMDGMPSVGSVAFPPSCVEDRAWLKTVGVVAQKMEGYLAKVRGEKKCLRYKDTEEGEAKAWGIEKSFLKSEVHKKLGTRYTQAQLDETFNKALHDLQQHGLIVTDRDSSRQEYVASLRSDMDLKCQVTVAARQAWTEWRGYLYALLVTAVGLWLGKLKLASNRVESSRVASLVQDALQTLRQQELAHHTDPVTAPYPFLSSLHLRDLVLQDEHSIPARRRLWNKVERVVEGNANVRANLEDVNGDETRVWRWVGGSPVNRRIKNGDAAGDRKIVI